MSYQTDCLKPTFVEQPTATTKGIVRWCHEPLGHDVGVDCTPHRTIYRRAEKFWPLPISNERNA